MLAQFESEQKVQVISVDIDHKDSKVYKQYGKFFPGGGIPHAVLIDDKNNAVTQIHGYKPYPALLEEYKAATSGKK